MASRARRSRGPQLRQATDLTRDRVLSAFSASARRNGIRSLMMNELATELRMSASTLYKLYSSKEALALACVERWADELGAAEAAKHAKHKSRDGFEQYMHWIDAWADANADLSPAFARDLKSDYPAVWARYREIVESRKQRGAKLLRTLLKPEIDPRIAFTLLNTIFTTVLEPEFAEHLHISRREALRTAVMIWAGGALARRSTLRSVRPSKAARRPR
jgi:AcrR family transcriptional regulator